MSSQLKAHHPICGKFSKILLSTSSTTNQATSRSHRKERVRARTASSHGNSADCTTNIAHPELDQCSKLELSNTIVKLATSKRKACELNQRAHKVSKLTQHERRAHLSSSLSSLTGVQARAKWLPAISEPDPSMTSELPTDSKHAPSGCSPSASSPPSTTLVVGQPPTPLGFSLMASSPPATTLVTGRRPAPSVAR